MNGWPGRRLGFPRERRGTGKEARPQFGRHVEMPCPRHSARLSPIIILIFCILDLILFRSEVNFHVKRKTKMETLKTLCARSVAARVTSKKYLRHIDESYQEEPVPDGT